MASVEDGHGVDGGGSAGPAAEPPVSVLLDALADLESTTSQLSLDESPVAPLEHGHGATPTVGIVYDAAMLKHRNEFYPHPEQPARIECIHARLDEEGLVARCVEHVRG